MGTVYGSTHEKVITLKCLSLLNILLRLHREAIAHSRCSLAHAHGAIWTLRIQSFKATSVAV
jgi:hypothetical protein